MKFRFCHGSNRGQGSTQSPTCPSGEENKEHSTQEQTALLAQEVLPAACIHPARSPTMAVLNGAPTTRQDTACLLCPISFSQAARAKCLLTARPWAFPCMEASGTRQQGPEIILQAEQPTPAWQQDNKVALLNLDAEDSSKFLWMQRWQAATGNTEAPVWYTPQRTQSLGHDQNGQAPDPTGYPPPLSLITRSYHSPRTGSPFASTFLAQVKAFLCMSWSHSCLYDKHLGRHLFKGNCRSSLDAGFRRLKILNTKQKGN